MLNLEELIESGLGDLQLKVTLNDLLAFADRIVSGMQQKTDTSDNEDEMMTRKEVLDYLQIKSTTLWTWEKKNILSPHKVGRKSFYKKSDLVALQRGEVLAQ